MTDLSKQYLTTTAIINFSFYLAMLLSAVLELGERVTLLHPIVLFYTLFIIDFLGTLIGWRMLKENKKDKYVRLGFVINVVPIIAFILYDILFSGLSYS